MVDKTLNRKKRLNKTNSTKPGDELKYYNGVMISQMAMKSWFLVLYIVRTFCGYQRGNQKPKEQTIH